MRTTTWLPTVLILLFGIAGVIVALRPIVAPVTYKAEPVFERETETEMMGEETRDSPEFRSRNPEGWRPTRWTPLDDNGPNRRCNQDHTSQGQNETPCAANPLNPDAVIVGANDYATGNVRAGYYRSWDGGNTWQLSLSAVGPANIACDFAGDPAITADATGKFYAVYCTYFCNSAQGVYAQTSISNGQSWSAPVAVGVIDNMGVAVDKPHATCDISLTSPYVNTCYAAWMNVQSDYQIDFSKSVDGGVSFSNTQRISIGSSCWCPALATGPDGQVYAVWHRYVAHRLIFRSSLDGGATWNPEVTVSTSPDSLFPGNPCGFFRLNHYPVVASDISNSPYRGNVYICWNTWENGVNGNIYFSRSTDGGLTWAARTRVNDDTTTRMQWWPWMAVHPRTGDVGISWLDRRDDPTDCDYQVYATISTDGGATWAPNFPISDQTLDPENSGFLGDYTGTTFSNMGFLSSWADPRNDECDAYATWWNNGNGFALDSPNGDEVWGLAEPCTVSWHYRYAPDTIAVELNRNYPAGTWETLGIVASADSQWIDTVAGAASSNARIRLRGLDFAAIGDTSDADFTLGMEIPQITAYRVGNDIRIRWRATSAPYYHVYSSINADGPFTTLEGTTTVPAFLDLNAVSDSAKFYIVRASSEP